MGLVLQDAITRAREILNDPREDTYTSTELLRHANDALDILVTVKPNLFYASGVVTCLPNLALQTLDFDDARSLVDIVRVVDGDLIRKASRTALDMWDPNWQSGSTGTAVHWFPCADSPVRFYIYPPSPPSQEIEVLYVKNPDEYQADDDTGLPTMYVPAIAAYIVAMCESRDDEHVSQGRVSQFMQMFSQVGSGSV